MPKRNSSRQPKRERRLRVRDDLRREPDLHKLANAVIALALAQAEKEAREQRELDLSDEETPNA